MSAEDELAIPEIPEARPEDPEDVSWALSTAEAMWARGDHLEGIKWVRKAAEAAADAEDDARALELAKVASELTTLLARRSRTAVDSAPPAARSAPPPGAPVAKSVPPVGRSAPPAPIPLPSRASSAPQAPHAPPAAPARAAPRPLATRDTRQGPQPGRGVLSNRTATEAAPKSVRGRRRSRENLDAEAKQSTTLDTAPHAAVDGATADRALGHDSLAVTAVGTAIEVPGGSGRGRRRSRSEPDPTVVVRRDELVAREQRKSAAEWDTSPTQNLSGAEMEQTITAGDRATTTYAIPAVTASPSAPPPAPRPPASTIHDPEIQTSQAVRVIVWRDADGVHIAPEGTVVSAITIDAVLVALEPSADLTAWLSHRER